MSPLHRVVVTGMGQVSALGTSIDDFFQRLLSGSTGVRRIEGLDAPGVRDPIGAPIPEWDPEEWLPREKVRATWDVSHYAYAAARQAIDEAGLARADRPRGGVYVGTGFGGIGANEATYLRCFSRPGTRPRPNALVTGMSNATAGFLSSEFRMLGPSLTIMAACASANHAIGQASHLLRQGSVDVMLAGGADAPLTQIVMAAWATMRILAPPGDDPSRACRPFSADRAGMSLGEGAGFLVLETLSHARARGADVLAEVSGYGANADGGHMTHPDPQGVADCMRLALADARLTPSDIDLVSSHGTGTAVNDRLEADAVFQVLEPDAGGLAIHSTKAAHGHAMGASGALEAIASIKSIRSGLVPPTANLIEPDPTLPPLRYVRGGPTELDVGAVLSNSFGFGGTNAVLVLRRFRDE